MKRKNIDGSFWLVLFTLFFSTITLLITGALFSAGGDIHMSRADVLSGVFLNGLKSFICLAGLGAALWLRWREALKKARVNDTAPVKWRRPGKNFLSALAVFVLIASGPFWLPIHLVAHRPGEWMLLYALYLLAAGLLFILPCFLIYSLGRSLAEKDTEKEELDEAKKY